MAHDIYELIARTLELKRKKKDQEEILQEVYELVDEYNIFVKNIDKRLDAIITKLEVVLEDEY